MKCEKCGKEFPHRKGRFCGTCNWNSPGFVYGENMVPEPMTSGYYGHETDCDCAVCENMYFHELHLKRVEETFEAIKQHAYKMGFNAAKCKMIEAIGDIPTRVEAISGQNFTYIQRGEAIGTVEDLAL